jgi:hypothetical protein
MKITLLLGLFFYSNVVYAQNTGEFASPVQAGAYLPGIMGVRD